MLVAGDTDSAVDTEADVGVGSAAIAGRFWRDSVDSTSDEVDLADAIKALRNPFLRLCGTGKTAGYAFVSRQST